MRGRTRVVGRIGAVLHAAFAPGKRPWRAPNSRLVFSEHVLKTSEAAHVRRDDARAPRAAGGTPRLLRGDHDAGAAERDQGQRGRRAALPRRAQEDGRRRLAGDRLAQGIRRPGPHPDRADDLRRRGAARRLPAAVPDAEHRRPDDHEVRLRRDPQRLPAAHPRRRVPFLHRLLGAGGGHRPRLAQDQGACATATSG